MRENYRQSKLGDKNPNYNKPMCEEQKDKLIANSKSYYFMGEFKVIKDSKGNKTITFDGKSAAPKTINPNPTGAK